NNLARAGGMPSPADASAVRANFQRICTTACRGSALVAFLTCGAGGSSSLMTVAPPGSCSLQCLTHRAGVRFRRSVAANMATPGAVVRRGPESQDGLSALLEHNFLRNQNLISR